MKSKGKPHIIIAGGNAMTIGITTDGRPTSGWTLERDKLDSILSCTFWERHREIIYNKVARIATGRVVTGDDVARMICDDMADDKQVAECLLLFLEGGELQLAGVKGVASIPPSLREEMRRAAVKEYGARYLQYSAHEIAEAYNEVKEGQHGDKIDDYVANVVGIPRKHPNFEAYRADCITLDVLAYIIDGGHRSVTAAQVREKIKQLKKDMSEYKRPGRGHDTAKLMAGVRVFVEYGGVKLTSKLMRIIYEYLDAAGLISEEVKNAWKGKDGAQVAKAKSDYIRKLSERAEMIDIDVK